MANINHFKILDNKCNLYFNILEKEIGKKINTKKDSDVSRFGFYLYVLECLTNIKDTNELVDIITDTDFNDTIYGSTFDDCGIDAIYIDEECNIIKLFNFKYREKFKADKQQSKNDVFISTKLINALINESSMHLNGKIKKFADEIIEKNSSKDIWKMVLYVVTNENVPINTKDGDLEELMKFYDIEIESISLDNIVNFMSIRPEPISAKLVLDNESILSYTESPLVSAKSYLMKISVSELIRITCDSKEYREKYNIEVIESLNEISMDYAILFDNVRGYLGDTQYNKNIFKTLNTEASKFFMFNNGITVVAEDIISQPINGKHKLLLEIKNLQVVNGGQTLRTIYSFKNDNINNLVEYLCDAEILVRVFKTGAQPELKSKIAEYTNSQNAISLVDLKSITTEQIQIEQILNDNNIIYARKIGDTGLENKVYQHKISLEKFAQILFSIQGNPDKASSHKKKIFEKYYDDIFGEETFDISDSANIVKRYFEIKKIYESISKYTFSEQKLFYVLYLDKNNKDDINNSIDTLENALLEYVSTLSPARKLITAGFRTYLEDNYIKK